MLLATIPLHAQEQSEDLFSMSLEALGQVEITGSTLTTDSLKTVPSAVTVFTHEEIKKMGLDTLDELMNLVPGFQSYRSSTTAQHYPFSSRGRRIGNPAQEVLIVVDGQRLDEPRVSGSAIVVPRYPLMQIERVEFMRGPGAAVYGSNAMMGVVNIVTRSSVNEVSAGYGSFNRKQAYLLTSQKLGEVVIDVFGRIETDDGDHYRVQDTFGPGRIGTDDPRDMADLNVKLNWRNTRMGIQHSQIKADNYYELNGVSNGFNEHQGRLGSVYLKQNFDWQSVNSFVWLSYSRSKVKFTGQLTAPGALAPISNPPSSDPLLVKVEFDDYSETRVQWHNDWKINDRGSLQFGAEFRRIDAPEVIGKNNFDAGDLANGDFPIRYYGTLLATTPVQTDSDRDIVGIYGQYQRQLFDKTHLTLGLRYDDFSGIDSQLSPRFGLVQEIAEHHSVKFLYGKAFRAPAENELNLINNPVLLGNPDLRPETVETWELIWVGQWPQTRLSLGYFENHFDDAIVQVPIGSSGTLRFENVNQDTSKGVEFEISHELNEHWLARTVYTYISDKPQASFREADKQGSVMVNYQRSRWNANLIAIYSGKRETATGGSNANLIKLDDYWQLFGKVGYRFLPDWQAYVQAKNLLDKDFETPTANNILTAGVPNRGRELFVGIVWEY